MAPTDRLSRRAVLQASGGAIALPTVSARSSAIGGWGFGATERCPEATIEPSMAHCEGANMADCADDHPETEALVEAVDTVLEEQYPTVGALLDDGFVPYFDLVVSEGGWSHWINPEYVGDDTVLDPERPESVLVDNTWWRPIGVMFIATEDGEPIEKPPSIYEEDPESGADDDGESDETEGDHETIRCSPWHAHAGLPGRYAWWKYRTVYEESSTGHHRLPCRTPCMMHVWTFPHPESVYAHGAPPQENRGGPPAEPAGFETDATPGEDRLSWKVLPDYLADRYAPDGSD